MQKKALLIVDDVEINRLILSEIFQAEYQILEAADGAEALEIINNSNDIAAVLLDLIMPKIDGLGVLEAMNKSGKIKMLPVFLITAADDQNLLLEGYHLGAMDIITKPIMPQFTKHRINNVIELFRHRNELEDIVAEQVAKLGHVNQSMIELLASVIEFRDCESGAHVKRICGLTKIIMQEVCSSYPEYFLPPKEIDKVVMSAMLHDVGKISIPDHILNKPGRLTPEEFEIMKEHTVKGSEILKEMVGLMDEETYRYSYDICRYHHERWDGKGYPDRLKGDEIPIWAQVVSVVDVYDALTSDRVYKKAFCHDTAVEMILHNECGVFNPKVLQAFLAGLDKLEKKSVPEQQAVLA